MRTLKYLTIVVSATLLLGCAEKTEREAKYANPVIENIGMFDSCEVKYVNRGYQEKSFYIARCDNTATTTHNWEQSHGKTRSFERETVITQELEKKQAEVEILKQKAEALSKLSPADKRALGVE